MKGSRKRFGPLKNATDRNIKKLSDSPGVYGLFSNTGKNLYIGKAKRFRADERVMEHKEKGKIPFKKIGFIPTATQEKALQLEQRLTKQRKPRYNKAGK